MRLSRRAALLIQNNLRRLLHRRIAAEARFEHYTAANTRYFEAFATLIQKTFRGYYVRKYIHDYYARKRYLVDIQAKNADVLAQMAQYARDNAVALEEARESKMRESAERLAAQLHHLKSTRAQAGVYNAPNKPQRILGQRADDFLHSTFVVR